MLTLLVLPMLYHQGAAKCLPADQIKILHPPNTIGHSPVQRMGNYKSRISVQ